MERLTPEEVHRLNHLSREAYVDSTLYSAFCDYADGKITKEAYTKIVNRWAPLLKTYRAESTHAQTIHWVRWKDASEVLTDDEVKEAMELWN